MLQKRKRKPVPRPRYTLVCSGVRCYVGSLSEGKVTDSLIDILFCWRGFFGVNIRPTQEALRGVYQAQGRRGMYYKYKPSSSYVAYMRVMRMRQNKWLRNRSRILETLK